MQNLNQNTMLNNRLAENNNFNSSDYTNFSNVNEKKENTNNNNNNNFLES
jgi:hypothetical protein